MYRGMQRLRSVRTSGSSILRYLTVPQLRRKATDSLSAIQDTYLSTKDIFERHRVVFTVSTSIASVATALIGYSLRYYHDTRVDKRLESIETAMKNNHEIGDSEFRKLVSNNVSLPSCLATAGTTLVLGYGLGWRGGRWYQTRKFRKEQMKLLGQVKAKAGGGGGGGGGWSPKFLLLLRQVEVRRSLLKILKNPLTRARLPGTTSKTSETSTRNAASVSRKAAAEKNTVV